MKLRFMMLLFFTLIIMLLTGCDFGISLDYPINPTEVNNLLNCNGSVDDFFISLYDVSANTRVPTPPDKYSHVMHFTFTSDQSLDTPELLIGHFSYVLDYYSGSKKFDNNYIISLGDATWDLVEIGSSSDIDTMIFDAWSDIRIFSSNRAGGYGGYDLYYQTYDNELEAWSTVKNLGPYINSEYDERMPYIIEPDDQYSYKQEYYIIMFSSNKPGGKGGFDMYMGFHGLNSIK